MKKKLLPMLAALIMILCMSMPVSAATPTFKAPELPKVPDIKVNIELPEETFDNWIEEHPINVTPANMTYKDWVDNLRKWLKNYL